MQLQFQYQLQHVFPSPILLFPLLPPLSPFLLLISSLPPSCSPSLLFLSSCSPSPFSLPSSPLLPFLPSLPFPLLPFLPSLPYSPIFSYPLSFPICILSRTSLYSYLLTSLSLMFSSGVTCPHSEQGYRIHPTVAEGRLHSGGEGTASLVHCCFQCPMPSVHNHWSIAHVTLCSIMYSHWIWEFDC